MDRVLHYPWGQADVQNLAAAATIEATIENTVTIITVAILATNATLNLTVAANLPIGSILFLKWSTTATETMTFGTGIDSATVNGVAGKNRTQGFIWDGTSFKPLGTNVQID